MLFKPLDDVFFNNPGSSNQVSAEPDPEKRDLQCFVELVKVAVRGVVQLTGVNEVIDYDVLMIERQRYSRGNESPFSLGTTTGRCLEEES